MLTIAMEMITGYQRSLLVFNLSHWRRGENALPLCIPQIKIVSYTAPRMYGLMPYFFYAEKNHGCLIEENYAVTCGVI